MKLVKIRKAIKFLKFEFKKIEEKVPEHCSGMFWKKTNTGCYTYINFAIILIIILHKPYFPNVFYVHHLHTKTSQDR